jgi:phosphate transport system substrate-binding protein
MAAGFVLGMILLGVSACGNGGGVDGGASGPIAIDGSSTVYPFAQAASEVFQGQNKGVRVTVGESGTGGGFEKFCKGETDISNASRPIADDETALCQKNGITPAEIQIANDGIAIATNKALKIACLTTDQLGQLWQTNSTIKNYNELDPSFPNTEASLYGPGTDSGTFDFFTETTTSRQRTTTCWSKVSPATRADSATSGSPTSRQTKTN